VQASRRELLDDFLDFVGESTDANARNTAERLLNRALHTIWMKHPWRQFLMPMPLEVRTVVGQRSYALPPHFGRVWGGNVRNLTRDGAPLTGLAPDVLEKRFPDAGTSREVPGQTECYTVSGTCGVDVLLPAPTALMVESTSGSDAGTVVVTIEGPDVNGRWRRQSITLFGQAQLPVPVDVIPWLFGKAMAGAAKPTTELTSSVGTVLLKRLVGAEMVASLLPTESAVEHQVLTLYPSPSMPDERIVVPYLRALTRVLYDSDPIPRDWQDAVFEEMTIQWRVNTGEMSVDTMNMVRPKFLDLLAYEQADRFGVRPSTRPFLG
jgi:hypothetical protein